MKNSDYELTLFTCTYGGASRVVVRCSQVDMTAEESAREKAVRRSKTREEEEIRKQEEAAALLVEDFNDGR